MTTFIAAVFEMLGLTSTTFDFDLDLDLKGEEILAQLMERSQ